MSATPEPDPLTGRQGQQPVKRLTRLQQLTLKVLRHAAATVARRVPPEDVLAHVAIQAVLAVVRDTSDPIGFFARHHNGEDEYGLVISIAGERSCNDLLCIAR